jgi:serine/threonine-protein kinase RsbW
VYGYTYFGFFYQPEKIRELIAAGLLVSAVSVNSRNEVVGNLSLFFETAGGRVADSGAAMVDPRYRGHNLFKRMKMFLKEYAAENGMYGLYSEAVTIHTFTQQGNISLGAKETGIMLAYIKEKWTFKKINNDQLAGQRQATVLYYLRTGQEPQRTVYISERFFPILKKVYDNLGLLREVVKTNALTANYDPEVNSMISSTFKPDLNVAVISVSSIGADAFDQVRQQLREFCLNKVETIYLEMPVDTPVSAVLSEKLSGLGFMLSGIVPEFRNGDYIKMQYLNNVRVDPAKINIAADLAKELLAEIMNG